MTIRKFWWGLLTLTLVGVSAVFFWKLIAQNSAYRVDRHAETALPVLGTIQDFSLVDQSHNSVTRQSLVGHIWVADFIYTTCGDQCPRLTQKMAALQALLPKEADILLLSISVDPRHDTPEVLSPYARRFHADPKRWKFLTGSPKGIHALVQNFKLAPPDQGSSAFIMNHSNRLVIVDAQSRIRGYYEGTDDAELQRLIKDLSRLANQDARS